MSTASAERDDAGSGPDMILGSPQGDNNVRHIEKFPIRLNLQRGEFVAYEPEFTERRTTNMNPNRKQTVNMKKSQIGEGVIAQGNGVKMIVEEQKKKSVAESTTTKKSQFTIQQDSSDSNEEVNRFQPVKQIQNKDMDFASMKKYPVNTVQY